MRRARGLAREFKTHSIVNGGTAEDRAPTWLAFAQWVAADVGDLAKPFVPDRPETLPEDGALWKALNRRRRAPSKLSKGDREVLEDFDHWRDSVEEAESKIFQRLKCLLRAVWSFEVLDEPEVAGEIASLRGFILDEYGIEEFDRELDPIDQHVLSEETSRQRDTLPLWMVTGDRPPGLFIPPDEPDKADKKADGGSEEFKP